MASLMNRQTMTLKDYVVARFKKQQKMADRDFEQMKQQLLDLKAETMSEFKKENEKLNVKLMQMVKAKTEATQKQVADFVKVDPMPRERLELIKSEIKADLKSHIAEVQKFRNEADQKLVEEESRLLLELSKTSADAPGSAPGSGEQL